MSSKKNNLLYSKLTIFQLLTCFLFVKSTVISEGYHFFDNFYYKDLYDTYIKQKSNKKCSIDDGPNCFFIDSKNKTEIQSELSKIPHSPILNISESLQNISSKIKKSINGVKNLGNEKIDQPISLNSPIVLSLLLNFESYDEKTRLNDIYAPETIDTPYDVGRVTLSIIGKLRLTQKNSKLFEQSIIDKEERPKGTYAVVESKEVVINFKEEGSIYSLYIKKNDYNRDNKMFILYGYKNDNKYVLSKMQNVPKDRWIRIQTNPMTLESIVLPRGFDYDNILIVHSSVGDVNYKDYTKKFSESINEKITNAVAKVLSNLKSGKKASNEKEVKIIEIQVDANELVKNENEENFNFEIPEELAINNNDNKNKNINKENLKDQKEEKNDEKYENKKKNNNKDYLEQYDDDL